VELSYFEYCLFVEGKKVALFWDEKMMKILMFWDVADAATFLRLLFVMREERGKTGRREDLLDDDVVSSVELECYTV